MKKIAILFLSLLFVFWGFSAASAATVGFYDWAFNVNGDVHEYGDTLPTSFDDNAFNWTTGLGTLTWSTNEVRSHSFIAFFDHEIDETTNSYFNEYGEAVNMPEVTQSWEIDEPGYVFGDIYEHVTGWNGATYTGTIGLDNDNAVSSDSEDDVSMAMGWDFDLAANKTATIDLFLSATAPTSGFYLSHTDLDSNYSIYFSSILEIDGGVPPAQVIPEPATMILLGTGLAGLFGIRRKMFRK